jgi:hypothetical protein
MRGDLQRADTRAGVRSRFLQRHLAQLEQLNRLTLAWREPLNSLSQGLGISNPFI